MNLKEVINKRHSVRSFENKRVPKEILKELVKDSIKAPSSSNSQPWIFYVVASKTKRDKVAEIMAQALKLYKKDFNKVKGKLKKTAFDFYSNMGDCQNVVFIYAKKDKKRRDSNIMSISAAVENLMLSAVNKKLGTCWVGSFRGFEKQVNRVLKAKKDEELIASILVGYPKRGETSIKRPKKKLNEVMKFI
jgi:nitroreductase